MGFSAPLTLITGSFSAMGCPVHVRCLAASLASALEKNSSSPALVVTIENVFRLARCPLGAKSPWRTADVAISFSNPGVD